MVISSPQEIKIHYKIQIFFVFFFVFWQLLEFLSPVRGQTSTFYTLEPPSDVFLWKYCQFITKSDHFKAWRGFPNGYIEQLRDQKLLKNPEFLLITFVSIAYMWLIINFYTLQLAYDGFSWTYCQFLTNFGHFEPLRCFPNGHLESPRDQKPL